MKTFKQQPKETVKTNVAEAKYFMAILNREGGVETVEWFATKKEAIAKANEARKNELDPFYRKDIFYGRIITK